MSALALKNDSPQVPTILAAPLTWTLAAVAVVASMVPGLPGLLEYDTVALAHGEFWRMLTGHLCHWNLDHLFWDLSVFLGLGTMCEWRSRRGVLGCVVGTAIATSGFMLVMLPEVPTYRGLSGIDTGLFTLLSVGMIVDARKEGHRLTQWTVTAMAAGLFAKLVYEILTSATLFVNHDAASFIPISAAHLLGAIVGIAIGLVETSVPEANSPLTGCSARLVRG